MDARILLFVLANETKVTKTMKAELFFLHRRLGHHPSARSPFKKANSELRIVSAQRANIKQLKQCNMWVSSVNR